MFAGIFAFLHCNYLKQNLWRCLLPILLLLAVAGARPLQGATIVLSQATVISTEDLSYDGADLVVSNCTVTIAGAHQFSSLAVVKGGLVTHPASTASQEFRMELAIQGQLQIDATSSIDVTGAGYLPGRTLGNTTVGAAGGAAGGSYGGTGGTSYYGGTANRGYGDYANPNELGSGGGYNGTGAGLVRIICSEAWIDGAVLANGTAGGWNQAGGSGGGILLRTGLLKGSGQIAATGGHGELDGGSGSGGRVAVYYQTIEGFDLGKVTAYGGYVGRASPGASGTVYLKAGNGEGLLRIAAQSGSSVQTWTPLYGSTGGTFQVDHLQVSGTNITVWLEGPARLAANRITLSEGAILTHQSTTATQEYALLISVTNELRIDTSAMIDASGRGYLTGRTLGNTTTGAATGNAGGSYGGLGGCWVLRWHRQRGLWRFLESGRAWFRRGLWRERRWSDSNNSRGVAGGWADPRQRNWRGLESVGRQRWCGVSADGFAERDRDDCGKWRVG
jgi:hypothetical protein